MLNFFDTFARTIGGNYSFNIKYKNQSLFMKIIGFLLFFNKDFITKYITTIGSTIYLSSEDFVKNDPNTAISVLAHELVHVSQANKYGNILFSILYLFPQCLAVLALLAPISLWFLLFLVFIAPIPAPFRAWFEFEACLMNLFVLNEEFKHAGYPESEIRTHLIDYSEKIVSKNFNGSNYWFMWPFRLSFEKNIDEIINGDIRKDVIYSCVRQAYLNAVSLNTLP